MPQLSNTMSLPMFTDIVDKETKYSSSSSFQSDAMAASVNKGDGEIALNCDSSVLMEIKTEIEEATATAAADEHDVLISCDTIHDEKKFTGTKSATTYLCHRCRQVFSSRDLFEAHYKQTYNEIPIYTCYICEKQMKNKRSYQRHFNRHSSAQKFPCSICSKKFSQEKLLKKHEAVHNLTTAKPCLDCKEEFFDLFKFKAHRRTHHSQNKKFHSTSAITQSRQRLDGDPPPPCENSAQCTICGKIMKNRSSLSMHSKIHSNDRQYACMVCDQKFVQKINLINHLKVHNSAKTHSCNECGKTFVGQSQLLRHCTQHTNVRSFECEICKKFYKTKRDLKLHLMVHSVQRPHKCSMCSKTFLSTSKLKQHLNIHSGDRPFKCRHCPKDFTNFPNWLKHTRRRHKVDHKTGEKLVVMPNFLSKTSKVNKAGKTKAMKTPPADSIDVTKTAQNDCLEIKNETSDNHIDLNAEKDVLLSQAPDKYAMPFVVTKSGSELSTITVNNRTLPLNTCDDLERAASLLMHQTLDLEDDFEFVDIKSESMNPCISDGLEELETSDKSLASTLSSDFFNYQYSNTDFLYSYYPQATQCDFAMMPMPLPPIATVNRKLKAISSSSSIFPGMANV